jgi:hypothetical protein
MKAEITTEHEVEDHERVLVVLKGVPEINDERMFDLLQQSAFLDDVWNCLLLYTLRFLDVLERIKLVALLVFYDSDFAESALADDTMEIEVVKTDICTEINGF